MSEWIENLGEKPPFHQGAIVEIRFKSGTTYIDRVNTGFDWSRFDLSDPDFKHADSAIVAYRVL